MRWLAKNIFFKILGWQLEDHFVSRTKKCVVIVAPHTSSFDFLLGILVRKIMQIEFNFVGKEELFKPPFGWYFKWVGGAPLDRSGNKNKVDSIAKVFEDKDVFRLALSPEGTREKTSKWRTGFYYIALKANVPILMVSFDYKLKKVKISEAFKPTGDFELDFKHISLFYKGVEGKVKENY